LGHDQRAFLAVKAGEVFPSQRGAAIIRRDLADAPQPVQPSKDSAMCPDAAAFTARR
jgi:hypothetical protein